MILVTRSICLALGAHVETHVECGTHVHAHLVHTYVDVGVDLSFSVQAGFVVKECEEYRLHACVQLE